MGTRMDTVTFVTELLLAGVPLERVSILLGHSSIRITTSLGLGALASGAVGARRRSTWIAAELVAEGTSEGRRKR